MRTGEEFFNPSVPNTLVQHVIRWVAETDLAIFLERFFKLSHFKRSCMSNGPKVGSGGSLSPRGDWRAPSDGAQLALVRP